MRHRAEHRYTNNKHRGKHIPQREVARRIAQSHGWDIKQTLHPQAEQPQREKLSGDTVIIA